MKKKIASLTLICVMLIMLMPSVCKGMEVHAAAQDTVAITTNDQSVDSLYGVPAKYIPGINNSNSGGYSCAGYVHNFYSIVYGVTVSNLLTGNTPIASAGSFSVTSSPRIGDIGYQTNKSGSGHWFILKEINSDGSFSIIEQNWKWQNNGTTYCNVNRNVSYSKTTNLKFFRWSNGWSLNDTLPTTPTSPTTPTNTTPSTVPTTVQTHEPQGVFDSVKADGNMLVVKGWTYDPDNTAASVSIHAYVDDGAGGKMGIGSATADRERTDVDNAYHCGTKHGFEAAFSTQRTGTYNVYVYALNLEDSAYTLLGTKQVTVVSDLRGNYEGAKGDQGTINVSGWAYDNASPFSPIGIHVYYKDGNGNNQWLGGGAANLPRSDVNNVFGVGENHGFNMTFPAPGIGSYNVLVYAISADGKASLLLGTKQVTVTKDTKLPSITDVKVTVQEGIGYTVACKVTDNAAVAKVQFPTWTEKNGQDDLDSNWTSSALSAGKKNGDFYTYTVKISDHKNELGTYQTHIYAWDKTGNCAMTCVTPVVVPPAISSVFVKDVPEKAVYTVGDTLDTSGLVLTVHYADGSTKDVISGFTCTPTELNSVGKQTVSVGYNGKTATFDVQVAAKVTLTNLILTSKPGKLNYDVNDTLDTTGMALMAVYSDGSVKDITSGFTCTPTALNTAGSQTVTVSYGGKTATFDVTVAQSDLLTITAQPANVSGAVNANVSLTVKATGTGLSYQWYIKKANESSFTAWNKRTSASVSTPVYASWNNAQFYCLVKDANGNSVKSNTVKLTVTPKITTQPANASGAVNANVSFTVKATGSGLTYQWYVKKANESSFTAWNKRTSASVSTPVYASWNNAQFYCVVKDGNGKTVKSNTVTLTVTPKITAQPANASGAVNANVSFTVKATGSGLTYQWYVKKSGDSSFSAWNKKTSASVSTPVYASWNNAQFYCVVKDGNGKTVKSNTVTLTVTPKITTQPANASGAVNGKATFTVKATGAGLSYQWYYKKSGQSDWTKWNNQTGSSASLTIYKSWNDAQFYCLVKDANGNSVKSNTAVLTVK